MRFYLGTHHPDWLAWSGAPLCVSRRRLERLKTLPRAKSPWILDSGGFFEVGRFGGYCVTAEAYVAFIRRCRDEVGQLEWATSMDWMCEPKVIAKTQRSVTQHQELSIDSYIEMRSMAPDLPIIPVVQGWSLGSYWEHLDAYARRRVDLDDAPCVGVGTVCGRDPLKASLILGLVADENYSVHGFGVAVEGVELSARQIRSSDSLAWSKAALYKAPLPGHDHKHCNNCPEYALEWREHLLAKALRENPGLQLE